MNGKEVVHEAKNSPTNNKGKGYCSDHDLMRDWTNKEGSRPRVDAPRRIEKIGVDPERMDTRSWWIGILMVTGLSI